MRCPDAVMSAMSCHPRYRSSQVARAYWEFTERWQRPDGGLHRLGGQWYLVELASRFRFRAVRRILAKALPMAARLQRPDGSFQKDCPGPSACQVVLAYSRHGMLERVLRELRRDPVGLIDSLRTPLAVRTLREALHRPKRDLASRLARQMVRKQRADGSWGKLILATAEAINALLDCGLPASNATIRKGCSWLLAQQRPIDAELFQGAPPANVEGMFFTSRLDEEIRYVRARHPEYRWKPQVQCVSRFPFYQTGLALSVLCRCGRQDYPVVEKAFRDLLKLRGPGGEYYTDHWCACNLTRWVRTAAPKFGRR